MSWAGRPTSEEVSKLVGGDSKIIQYRCNETESLDHADKVGRCDDRSSWAQTETSTGRKIRSSEGIGSP
jgi:hypothetical protein